MQDHLIAYDFGTGGIKASLYTAEGMSLASTFEPYDTIYPQVGWHEQRPADWWESVIKSTNKLLSTSGIDKNSIAALAISGHSLGVVPIDRDGRLLLESAPIWSDMRAEKQAKKFFRTHSEKDWYMKTGNGFPSHLYSAFKLLWYRDNMPEMFNKISFVLGTKDYINYKLTGAVATDPSYASGIGFYSLKNNAYDEELLAEFGFDKKIFPEIVPSTHIIGTLTREAAHAVGLSENVRVACGGVDNSCMALGARGIEDGRVYTSLGSSSWIAITSHDPILDPNLKPFVFAHVIPDMYASATSIFSAGSSFQWVRNELCRDLMADGADPYIAMNEFAAQSPIGANKLLFNPSLAGGSGSDRTSNVRGAYLGLDLKHTRQDLIRAAMEGIALSLRIALDRLKEMSAVSNEMLIVGGGGKSQLWRQMFADIYGLNILQTSVGQDAGSLGAAALAAVGAGFWKDFAPIDSIHKLIGVKKPDPAAQAEYNKILSVLKKVNEHLYDIGDIMASEL
jgi:xylulokinase